MTTHYSGRKTVVPDLFIEHYTAGAGTAASTAAFMERAGNSVHAIIGRNGDIEEPVAIEFTAWHAGDKNKTRTHGSRFPSAEQLQLLTCGELALIPIAAVPYRSGAINRRSVGIEHVNLGWAYADKSDAVKKRHRNPASRDDDWQPYTAAQIAASRLWHQKITRLHPSIRYVCGHEDVTHRDTMGQVGAKVDPGPAFPWHDLLLGLPLQRIIYDFAEKGWALCRE